jgi:hypothetical protein
MQVTSQSQLGIAFTEALLYGIGGQVNAAIAMTLRSAFRASGSAIDQCDLIYCKNYPLTAAPVVIDLQSITDVLAGSIAFARLRMIALRNNGTGDGQIVLIGANGANDFLGLTASAATVTLNLYPSTGANDGFMIFQAPNVTGMLVGSSTHLLKLDPQSATLSVDLLLAGCAE